jgi:hypothetical protein
MQGDSTRAGESDVDGEKIPRAWIGEEVEVYWRGGQAPDTMNLIDVVPEGLVFEVSVTREHEGKTYKGTGHTLTPWHAIVSVQKYVRTEEIDQG